MGEKNHGTGREMTREERRKAALRANLQRRKSQARARDATDRLAGSGADSAPVAGSEKEQG